MRNLEVIETELAAAREALSSVKGTPAEVYSRIVGYYRSVRNWNRGKREEYEQRVMFQPDTSLLASCTTKASAAQNNPEPEISWTMEESASEKTNSGLMEKILLFIRPVCPACPSVQAAAGRLGLPLELYDADTDEGLAEAVRYQVMSTPTAILVSSNGREIGRAHNTQDIKNLLEAELIHTDIKEAVAV